MSDAQAYPGASLGLPQAGAGSLATWGSRVGALIIDWAASMLVAIGLFGTGVLTGSGWRLWMPMAVYFVQKAGLTALTGSSFGQLIAGVGVTRADGGALGPAGSLARAALVCLVLPTLIVGPERRALDDVLLGTVVVRRRA